MCEKCKSGSDRDREEARQLLTSSLAQASEIRGRLDTLLSQVRGHQRKLAEAIYRAELARIALGLDRAPDDFTFDPPPGGDA
jgi:hypothetical protein